MSSGRYIHFSLQLEIVDGMLKLNLSMAIIIVSTYAQRLLLKF